MCTPSTVFWRGAAYFSEKVCTPIRKKFCTVPSVKGYGAKIERARIAEGLSPEELARKLHRRKSIVYRLENEEQEPTADQINILVRELAISAEDLMLSMGVAFNPPEARLLPKRLVDLLMPVGPEGWRDLIGFLERNRAAGQDPR